MSGTNLRSNQHLWIGLSRAQRFIRVFHAKKPKCYDTVSISLFHYFTISHRARTILKSQSTSSDHSIHSISAWQSEDGIAKRDSKIVEANSAIDSERGTKIKRKGYPFRWFFFLLVWSETCTLLLPPPSKHGKAREMNDKWSLFDALFPHNFNLELLWFTLELLTLIAIYSCLQA